MINLKIAALGLLPAALLGIFGLNNYKSANHAPQTYSPDPAIQHFQRQVDSCLSHLGENRQNSAALTRCRDRVSRDQDKAAVQDITNFQRLLTAKLHQDLSQADASSSFDVAAGQKLAARENTQLVSLTEYVGLRHDFRELKRTFPDCMQKAGFDAKDSTELSKKYTDFESEYADKNGLSKRAFEDRAQRANKTYRRCHEPITQYVIGVETQIKEERSSLLVAANRLGL